MNCTTHPALWLSLALIATPAAAQRLIAVDSTPGGAAVYELDPVTAAATLLGSMSPAAGIPAGLAYDSLSGRLFMSGAGSDSVYVVDVTNWEGQLIGPYGNPSILMHGLEWDNSTGTLYGASAHDAGIYTIDTTTGAATLVGLTGLSAALSNGLNLGYDPVFDVLYLTSTATDSLYTIDRSTGVATLVGAMTGITNVGSLAYSLNTVQMFVMDNIQDLLYTVDLTTGTPTAVGSVGVHNMIGMAYLPEAGRLSRQPHGCGPTTITATGSPSQGRSLNFQLGAVVGLPLVGFGLNGTTTPFCGCTIGHEWFSVAGGASVQLRIPAGTSLLGVQVFVQGADLLGVGGCANPQFTVTDTITLTIG